jgi:hypothetical protein
MLHTAMLLAYADVSGEVNSLESQVEQSLKDDTNSRTLAYKDAVYSQAVLTLCKCSKFQEALSLFKRIQEYGDPLLWSALELLKGVDQNTRIEICEQCFRRYATFCGNDNNTNVCVGSNELLCILQTYLTEGKTLEDFWTFVRTLPEQKRSAVLRALCDGPQKNFSSDEQERLREIASKANV